MNKTNEVPIQTSTQPQWFVLYTKARCEKKVAEGLKEQGFEVYCPMLRTKRRWSDRYKWVEEPLLRSYCFVRLAETQRHLVFNVSHVVRYLFWQGKPAIVREAEITALQHLLDQQDHERIALRSFNVNDRIKIKGGLFDLLEGEITEKRGDKLVVYMEALQLAVYLDARTSKIEKIA